MRDTLQIFFIFIELLAYCTLLVGYAKQLLVSKELKKQTAYFHRIYLGIQLTCHWDPDNIWSLVKRYRNNKRDCYFAVSFIAFFVIFSKTR